MRGPGAGGGGEGKGGLSPGKEFGTGRAEFGRQQPSLGEPPPAHSGLLCKSEGASSSRQAGPAPGVFHEQSKGSVSATVCHFIQAQQMTRALYWVPFSRVPVGAHHHPRHPFGCWWLGAQTPSPHPASGPFPTWSPHRKLSKQVTPWLGARGLREMASPLQPAGKRLMSLCP